MKRKDFNRNLFIQNDMIELFSKPTEERIIKLLILNVTVRMCSKSSERERERVIKCTVITKLILKNNRFLQEKDIHYTHNNLGYSSCKNLD